MIIASQQVSNYLETYVSYRMACDSKCGKFLSGRFDTLTVELDWGVPHFSDAFLALPTPEDNELSRMTDLMNLRIASVVPNTTGHPSFQVFRQHGHSGCLAQFVSRHDYTQAFSDYVSALDHIYYVILKSVLPVIDEKFAKEDFPALMSMIRIPLLNALLVRFDVEKNLVGSDSFRAAVQNFLMYCISDERLQGIGGLSGLESAMSRLFDEFSLTVNALETGEVYGAIR